MSELQCDNPAAPNFDWQQDREWFNQRLARSNTYNSRLQRRIASLREGLRRIKDARVTKAELKSMADESIRADDVERKP